LFLAALGLSAAQLGLIVALGLAGNAAGTALVAVYGDRLGRRRTLMLASALSAAGLAGVAAATRPAVLGLAALAGMVNGMGRDRGPAQAVDQSLLADALETAGHTAAFTRYTFVQDVLGALGSLAAGVPAVLSAHFGLASVVAYRWAFLGAAVLSLAPLALYARVRDSSDALPPAAIRTRLRPESRRRVTGLVGLFALDSVGGGFLAGSILSYWFFRRYGLGGEALGPVFFAARALNAASYFGAAALARRVGLIRTMVFTHLPSSVVLLALPFVAAPWLAIALFLVRESLVQMDVPARQSYVAAVTGRGERTFALGVTSLARNVGWATGPGLAGAAMSALGLGAPLFAGAGLKIVYDVALYASYRRVRPAEES
jgi:MFS family permease